MDKQSSDSFSCTVVVTTYNSAKTLRRTLNSILNQSPIKAENVIVIDDASHDESARIAGEYPFTVIVNEVNIGSGGAKATGLSYVNTEYVAFLDADDAWDPNFLQLQKQMWKQNKDAAAIGLSLRLDSGTGETAFRTRKLLDARVRGSVTLLNLWKSNPFTSSAIVYAVEKLRNVGGYSKNSPVDDFETIVRLYLNDYVLLRFPFSVGIYGISQGQVTARITHQLKGQLRAYKLLSSAFPPEIRSKKIKQKTFHLWLRAIAKCANYGMSHLDIPNVQKVGLTDSLSKTLYRLLSINILWKLASSLWRAQGRLRYHFLKFVVLIVQSLKV